MCYTQIKTKSGYVNIDVKNKETGVRKRIQLDEYLTDKQQRAISTRPDMLWQFIQYLKGEYASKGETMVSFYAIGNVSLNGAAAKPLYDSKVDLAKVEWKRFQSSNWLLRYPN